MRYSDEALVIISALEHYSYCPRQCGLIHVECIYQENVFTLRGSQAHRRTHEATSRSEDGVRIERGLPLWSERLGLTGVADVVEFHPDGAVVPVEYKHGAHRTRRTAHADLQLCAQGLCLEEMLGVAVPFGAIYAHQTRRRRTVPLTPELREATETMVAAVRAMLEAGVLPPPVDDARCPNCSLIDACVPGAVAAAARRSSRELWRVPADL